MQANGIPFCYTQTCLNSTGSIAEKLADQVMQNPQVLAALQERLENAPHTPSSYIET